jgi:Rieske Fe-S protein
MTTKKSLPQIDKLDQLDRRHVLVLGAAGCLAACSGDPGGGGGDPDASTPDDADQGGGDDTGSTGGDDAGSGMCSPGPTSLGPVTNFAQGTWRVVSAARVIVGHDADGLFAYSNTCTHEGCAITSVTASSGRAQCRCHGATFDGNGTVLLGPARTALIHYEVTVCDGTAYVNRTSTVDPSTRVAV